LRRWQRNLILISTGGLGDEQIANRLAKYGYNELKREARVSPSTIFLRQFKNVLLVILLIGIILSAFIEEFIDAGIIGAIIVFSAFFWVLYRSTALRRHWKP
jgi:Ca2+-transporting ATPase